MTAVSSLPFFYEGLLPVRSTGGAEPSGKPFRKLFPAGKNDQSVTLAWETLRKQFPAVMNDKSVSCCHGLHRYGNDSFCINGFTVGISGGRKGPLAKGALYIGRKDFEILAA